MALLILFVLLFIQYLQSYIQQLVINILRREIHLPSLAKEWHIPLYSVPLLLLPLDEQDASYLALSASITNFSFNSILSPITIILFFYSNVKHMFVSLQKKSTLL